MIPFVVERHIWKKPDGCWIWTAGLTKKGYGKLTYKRKTWQAHRFVWDCIKGEIPVGIQLDHFTCYNRKCVNPEHLKLSDNQANGFNRAGANPNNKLNIRGVGFHNGRFRARYTYKGKQVFVGYFDTPEEADKALVLKRSLSS